MAKQLPRQIDGLKQKILFVGALVEEAIAKAISALNNRDRNLANSVIEADAEIDRMEVEVEEECLKVLALYQPVAADLRGVQWADDGLAVVAGSEAGEVLMWDLELAEVVERQGPSVGSQVIDAVIQADGTYVTIATDQTLRIWLSASVVALGVELTAGDPGTYSVAIASSGEFGVTGDGVFDDQAAGERLRVVAESGVPKANFEIIDGTGDKYSGEFQVSGFEMGGELDAVTYSVTLSSVLAVVRGAV